MIPGKKPDVVVSSTVVAAIVAAAIVFDEACAALGLMMLVQTNCIGAATNVAVESGLKMTVNTPDVRVAEAPAFP